jgi:ribosomal-protein-alanine N-acetyltransferase
VSRAIGELIVSVESGPLIRTRQMTLRLPIENDRAAFIRAMSISDEHMRPWMPRREDRETYDAWFTRSLARATREWQDGIGVRLLGFLDDGRIAGTFSLNNIVRGVFQNADAGWLVMADCLRRGIASEGVTAILGLALRPEPLGLGLHRVQANIIPRNIASLGVARKCGFREEGLAREMLMMDGQWQDHVMFAKLAREHNVDHGVAAGAGAG